MSDSKDFKFSLKVLLNKQKTKVLFAEGDSDFTDVLLSFLTLPLGTIVRVVKKHFGDKAAPLIGSLTTLYNGLSNLDSDHFWTEGCKQMFLNPISSSQTECRKLKLNVDDTPPTNYFKCENNYCEYKRNPIVSMYYDAFECDCGYPLSNKIGIRRDSKKKGVQDGDGGVFTINDAFFIISDDLQIFPSSTGSITRILSNLGVRDADGTEIKIVTFGFEELDSVTAKYEKGTLLVIEKEATSNTKKMIVKAILQKSTNKFLFAEADEDFIDFLFSLLTIPLGTVEWLLGNNTSLKNIDNLYRSIADIKDGKYLRSQETKTILLKPKLPFGYISETQLILPLNEAEAPVMYFREGLLSENKFSNNYGVQASPVKFQRCVGNYVRGQRIYMVTDDLTVTPLVSCLSILSGMNIRLSDVKELELQIGLEEALSILKASLTSTCAFTDALINPTLNKQPKQEQY